MNNELSMLEALNSKIAELRKLFPNRKLLVTRDDFVAIFERAEVGKDGVEIVVKPLGSGSKTMRVLWHPADFAILAQEVELIEVVKVALPTAETLSEPQVLDEMVQLLSQRSSHTAGPAPF